MFLIYCLAATGKRGCKETVMERYNPRKSPDFGIVKGMSTPKPTPRVVENDQAENLSKKEIFARLSLLEKERTYDREDLFHVARWGTIDELKECLKTNDINKENNVGDTALNMACRYGRTDLVKELLNRGADVSIKGDELRWDYLYFKKDCFEEPYMNGGNALVQCSMSEKYNRSVYELLMSHINKLPANKKKKILDDASEKLPPDKKKKILDDAAGKMPERQSQSGFER